MMNRTVMKQHKPDVRQPNLNALGQAPQRAAVNNQGMPQRAVPNSQGMPQRNRPQNSSSRGNPVHSRQQNSSSRGTPVRSRLQSSSGNPNTTMRPDPNSRRGKRSKKTTGKQIVMRILIGLLVFVILAGIGAFIYKDHLENQINIIPRNMNPSLVNEDGSIVSLSDVATETTTMSMPAVEGVHNILLIGIDSRSSAYTKDGTGNLADIIMILTVNEKDNTIKLTSVQRDSYVYIPGYKDPQKINAAMTYGGPPLLMHVLENHLRVNLEQYAFVDMNHMEKVVDAVGGVVVNVTEDERSSPYGLNDLVKEQNTAFGSPADSHMLTTTGDVLLDGRQAVAYARIRHVGNGDYDRSKRQVEVLQSLMHRFMGLDVLSKANALDKILSLVSTNITKSELEGYVLTYLPKIKSAEFQYLQIPVTGYSNEGTYSDFRSGEWSIRPNWNGLIPLVQEYMYGTTFPFDPVPVIPKAPTDIPSPTASKDDTQTGGN